jgi:hypothetical protein
MTSPVLDVYDVAFLGGGPQRVVDTAIVVLVRSGRLRVHSPGRLATADLVRRHPVEAAVLDAVGPTGHRSVDMVCWRLIGDDRMLDIGRRLRDQKLVGHKLTPGRHRPLTATRAGRNLLAEVGDLPGVDAEAMRVARGGRAGMTDKLLRAAIFEAPDTKPVIPRSRRPSVWDNPDVAAHRGGDHHGAGGSFVGGGYDGGGDGGF